MMAPWFPRAGNCRGRFVFAFARLGLRAPRRQNERELCPARIRFYERDIAAVGARDFARDA